MASVDNVPHDIQAILSSSERDYLVRNNGSQVLLNYLIFLLLITRLLYMSIFFFGKVSRFQFLFCSIRVVPLTYGSLYHSLPYVTRVAGFEFGTLRVRA